MWRESNNVVLGRACVFHHFPNVANMHALTHFILRNSNSIIEIFHCGVKIFHGFLEINHTEFHSCKCTSVCNNSKVNLNNEMAGSCINIFLNINSM